MGTVRTHTKKVGGRTVTVRGHSRAGLGGADLDRRTQAAVAAFHNAGDGEQDQAAGEAAEKEQAKREKFRQRVQREQAGQGKGAPGERKPKTGTGKGKGLVRRPEGAAGFKHARQGAAKWKRHKVGATGHYAASAYHLGGAAGRQGWRAAKATGRTAKAAGKAGWSAAKGIGRGIAGLFGRGG